MLITLDILHEHSSVNAQEDRRKKGEDTFVVLCASDSDFDLLHTEHVSYILVLIF